LSYNKLFYQLHKPSNKRTKVLLQVIKAIINQCCRFRKKDEDSEQRPFEVDGKEIFLNCSKQAKAKVRERTDKKGGKGQSDYHAHVLAA